MQYPELIREHAASLGRLAVAVLLAGGLALSSGGATPPVALADGGSASVLKVTTSDPDVLVTFHQTGGDEAGRYLIQVKNGSNGDSVVETAWMMGLEGRDKTGTVGLAGKFDPAATYCARIVGPYNDGSFADSDWVCADPPARPQTPELLTAAATGSSSIRVTWQDPYAILALTPFVKPSSSPPNFRLFWYVRDSAQQSTTDLPALSAGQPLGSYEVSGLQPHTTYCFRIYAARGDLHSQISDALCAPTDLYMPSADPVHCVACAVHGAPSQPDLSVDISGKQTLFSGMTATFTVTIKNSGAPLASGTNVLVSIAFGGKLTYVSTVDTGAFACNPGTTLNCTGQLDSSGQATLIFQGWASAPDKGWIDATVDPSQAIPDSNRANNSRTENPIHNPFEVTIK